MTAVLPDEDAPPAEREGPDPLVGTRLAGKYDLLDVLGEGAMGRIYRARQLDLDRLIAIKILHRHLGGEDRVARRFHREARAASRLSHPNSVQILDFGSSDGVLYIAMELLEGEDLQAVLDHDPPLSPHRIGTILIPVLRAVDEAHRAGIVHRDLKPENIILWPDRSGREHVKVCDFGIAKILDGEGNSITVDGFVCGTPQYMAPEQARGDVIDHRVDVYAAGVVLYQMLAGKVPFTGETALGIITKHLTDDPVPPSERDPERHVPATLEAIALKAMAKLPVDRYQTAGEMADALARAVADLGTDGERALSDPEMKRYSAPPRPRRDTTGGATTSGGRETTGSRKVRTDVIDTDAATREFERTLVPNRSRYVTGGLVALAALMLGVILYLLAQPGPTPGGGIAGDPTEPAAPEDDPVEAVMAPVPDPLPPEVAHEPVPVPGETASAPPIRDRDPHHGSETTPPTPPIEPVVRPAPPDPPVVPLGPGPTAFAEGRRLFLANDVQGAIARFEEAARLMPDNAEVQRQLGRAHMRAGDVSRSVAAYRRYLDLAPDAPDRTVVESIIARNAG